MRRLISGADRLESGRSTKSRMRRSIMRKTSAAKAAFSASLPSKLDGSGKPQCPVTGWPGHTGQDSPAAWSQTVKTKSITGAPGLTNSSQSFERMPSVGRFIAFSSRSTNGLIRPDGWLPALKAR